MTSADGGSVTGVRCADAAKRTETLNADLVVDASGRGALTLDTLRALGRPMPDHGEDGLLVFSREDRLPASHHRAGLSIPGQAFRQ